MQPDQSIHSKCKLVYRNPATLTSNKCFSQIVKVDADSLIFISGQVAFDINGKIGGANFEEQLKQCLFNVDHALNDIGQKWEDVVFLRFYVVDLKPENRFTVHMLLDTIYNESDRPASSLIGVQSLARKDLRVEVEVIAAGV